MWSAPCTLLIVFDFCFLISCRQNFEMLNRLSYFMNLGQFALMKFNYRLHPQTALRISPDRLLCWCFVCQHLSLWETICVTSVIYYTHGSQLKSQFTHQLNGSYLILLRPMSRKYSSLIYSSHKTGRNWYRTSKHMC